MNKRKLLVFLSIIIFVIVTVGLRVLYLNTDFWYDEACSWFSAKSEFPSGIMDNLLHLDLQHTPLYFFILHFWMKIFGDTEIAIRSLSVIFGILTVPLVYITSAKIMDKSKAVLAAVAASVSPLLVFFSVEARMYPIVVFLVLLSLNYLIDFEQKNDTKSLVKLVIVNLLIPYTLVGGILYNFSLALCYGIYLFGNKKTSLYRYITAFCAELVLLIPYFVLISYYAKARSIFVVSHEGPLAFFQIVDVIRNFFAVTIVPNPYWPSAAPYTINFAFALLVIVPCVYFVYGIVQGFVKSEAFMKTLYRIFIVNFVLAVIFSLLKVNVFTVRYILYLLPPLLILSIYGLSKRISMTHLKCFMVFFAIASITADIQYAVSSKILKTKALKSVAVEAQLLDLGVNDVIVMPIGADAPYYFRGLNAPRVFPIDFHKEARNPYNNKFYDESQRKLMDKPAKYGVIYDAVFADKFLSDNLYEYIYSNINATIPSGRFVLIALYGADASSLVTLPELRTSVTSVQDVKDRLLDILLKKYMYDLRAVLDPEFLLLNTYTKDNYTYLLLQKK